jgi:hypothetical protein
MPIIKDISCHDPAKYLKSSGAYWRKSFFLYSIRYFAKGINKVKY